MNVQNQPPLPRAPHPRPALTQLVPPFAARPTADRVWLVAAHGGAGWIGYNVLDSPMRDE